MKVNKTKILKACDFIINDIKNARQKYINNYINKLVKKRSSGFFKRFHKNKTFEAIRQEVESSELMYSHDEYYYAKYFAHNKYTKAQNLKRYATVSEELYIDLEKEDVLLIADYLKD